MASKIGKKEWWILVIIAGILDFIQFVIIEMILVWLFGIGIAINEIADPIIAGLTTAYLMARKVNLFKYPSRILSMAGVEVAAELTGGVAQFWFLDIWYIKHSVEKEEAAEKAAQEQQEMLRGVQRQFLNQDGSRNPQQNSTGTTPPPLNSGGIRAPGGGLKPPVIRDIKPPIIRPR